MKALYTAPALLLVGVLGVAAIGASSQSPSSAAGAAAACTWLDPQPERIALTMEQLTDEPVDAEHWATWVTRTEGLTASDYADSTVGDRHQLLVTAITLTIDDDLHPDITSPMIIWWSGAMPTDDTDQAWKSVTVPGWDGTLETYIGAYAKAYASDPDVLAAVEAASLPLACGDSALAAACPQPYTCPIGASAALAWAESQIGAPYTAISPYRFGIPSPGGERCLTRGTPPTTSCWNYPAGTIAYDCSGFVISAWQHGGLDFGQLGLHSSQDFRTSLIPDADRNALQPGDLAVYRPINGVGHIVLIHRVDPDGTVRTIEASADRGVYLGTLEWDRVTAIKHPTVPSNDGPEPDRYALPVDRGLLNVSRLNSPHHDSPAIDVMLNPGTTIYAPVSGRIVLTTANPYNERDCPNPNDCDTCGIGVAISAGGWIFNLCHLQRLDVHTGDHVDAGQPIGLSGNSGHSSAPHLHLEIRRTIGPVCPQQLLIALYQQRPAPSLKSLPTTGCTT